MVKKKTVKRKAVKKKTTKKSVKKRTVKAVPKVDDKLIKAGWAGVLALVLSLLVAYLSLTPLSNRGQLVGYVGVIVFATFFSVFYLAGFARLGRKTENGWLVNAAYMMIALTVVDVAYLLVTLSARLMYDNASIVFLIFYGAIAIIFGLSIWKLKDRLGKLAKATSVLNIISGILIITVVLAGIGVLLAMLTELLNLALMFKSAKAYA